jgi:hypothetical protein
MLTGQIVVLSLENLDEDHESLVSPKAFNNPCVPDWKPFRRAYLIVIDHS